jgi:hypothetical protein
MITGLSKAVALYLAPLLSLVATILSVLVFLAPSISLHTQVSLISVGPISGDGPSVWLGAIGESRLGARALCSLANLHRQARAPVPPTIAP